jgi:hypothetical protein
VLHPSFNFFQDGRFRIKTDPQLESVTQPKARGLLHMECDFATALTYNSTSRQMSWTTFQPRGSSSTIEDFSKQYSRTLQNYSKRLQDYSNYYSRLQCARGLVGHTPRVPMQGRMKTDSYYNSPVILLGLVPCNPTRTPAL